ncbi:hypothetical protein BC936DRAFT_141886 [Jimgerdemannia flammicorona]|uniref:SET domain-containing protein n=1 Tax=Jimgerdemannia flammicorona TaxID=994334 RepID=A0A433DFN0_9FUNG|nr:hypothetical protein BC936DRAFT_141886 [Jimgerdemannia flammicorona]
MFSHARDPNVGFIRDVEQSVIRYVTLREVREGEELCISYGEKVWFEEAESDDADGDEGECQRRAEESEPETEDTVFARMRLGEESDEN